MEEWRKQLYANELYHYGVKGMKWGKHLKLGLREFWNRDVTGKAWLRDAEDYRTERDRALRNAHLFRPLTAKERRVHPEYTDADRRSLEKKRANYMHEAARVEKGRMSLLKEYKNTSLKGMAEDKLQKGKRWLQNAKATVFKKKRIRELINRRVIAQENLRNLAFDRSYRANTKYINDQDAEIRRTKPLKSVQEHRNSYKKVTWNSVKQPKKPGTTVQPNKPYVSPEYKQEKAYNSQKNNYFGNYKPVSGGKSLYSSPSTKKTAQQDSFEEKYRKAQEAINAGRKYVDDEYQKALASNSRQNVYFGKKKKR